MMDYPKFHKFIFDLANLSREILMCEFQNKKNPTENNYIALIFILLKGTEK